MWKQMKTLNCIISKCSKLAQKESKAWYDFVGKAIHWELWKRLNFDYATKWYKHKAEAVIENEMHKIPLKFEIQTDSRIPGRSPDLVLINTNEKQTKKKKKRICHLENFAVPANHRVKKKNKMKG